LTLIVSAMIGKYSVLAADRKQSNLFTILINKSFLEDITKIRLVSGIAFTGTGRASILNDIKADFAQLINKDPLKLLSDDKIDYFNNKSDFKGLNFVITLQLNTGDFLHKFYLQGKNSYSNYIEHSNNRVNSNPFNIMVLQPADIDFNSSLKYCIKIFNDINNDDKGTIILKMKEIFNTYSKASKFVSSDFDIVFQNKNEESIIINVLSDK
jgi:hypothetical protein